MRILLLFILTAAAATSCKKKVTLVSDEKKSENVIAETHPDTLEIPIFTLDEMPVDQTSNQIEIPIIDKNGQLSVSAEVK
ncbi:MAG: hypothetical protein EOP10_24245 [Proteobacteria bacterium]|nr:MAG: hypothetical protein EOP10_24245 [Pseudomonadota bacterium]